MKKLERQVLIYLGLFTSCLVVAIVLHQQGYDTLSLLAICATCFFIGMFVRTAIATEEYRNKPIKRLSRDEYLEEMHNNRSSGGHYPDWIDRMYQ